MMKVKIFRQRMGRDASEFGSIEEVDAFVKQKLGRDLDIKPIAQNLCSCRGSVHKIVKYDDVEALLEKAEAIA